MDQECYFANNQKGQLTFICGEHRFTKNKMNKNGSTLWLCINRQECSISLSLDTTMLTITRETCESNDIKNSIYEYVAYLKKAVCQDVRPIQQIFEENDAKLRIK